ncbi:MAG: putative DNA binding domain-containing protein [Armatimonadetes bacterium]|nr:putative DNA binding domain-containing protein [Armatimonadota bacterium]
MTKLELRDTILNGESSGIELKRDDIQTHDLAKELVAFLNLEGGSVLLGVEDDRTVSGITRPDLEEWVMNVCRDMIRPPVIPFYEVIREVEPGEDVAVVRVNPGFNVHSLRRSGRDFYYIRVGTTSREASTEELARLFQQRGEFRAELRPVNGAALPDLDLRRLTDYFSRVRNQDAPELGDDEGWTQLLINTEIMVDEGVTMAGLLLFGKNPNRFLPQSGIDAIAFPGVEKDYAARERAALRGPLTPLCSEVGEIVENGLVEQGVEFVRRSTGVTAELEGGARRVERPDYPESAVREAIVNALIHRDYLLSGTDIEVSIYSDRLEVVSPGRLPNGITPERMRTGTRAARNQLVKDVMRDFRYLEHLGMGVRLKIVKGMLDFNGKEPGLIEEGERFTVTLYK